MMSNDVDLSFIDPDNPDLSGLEPHPADLSVVDGKIVLTMSDATDIEIASVNIPVDKTIVDASISTQGDLVVVYGDGTDANLGKIKGSRTISYTCVGQGVLSSKNDFELQFSPIPINNSLGLDKGVLSPKIDKLKYSHYSKFMAISTSQYGGKYDFGVWYITPLNYVLVNNLNLAFNKSIITLPAGKYYIRAHKTSWRNWHNMPRIASFDVDGNVLESALLLGQMSIGFGASTSSSTGYVSGDLTLTQETNIALYMYAGDNRQTYNPHHAGVGILSNNNNITYNCYGSLEIWELVNG